MRILSIKESHFSGVSALEGEKLLSSSNVTYDRTVSNKNSEK